MVNDSLLGEKIEIARKRKKLSQAKLAELVGVSRASISLYETGGGDPSYKVLSKLAEVLEMSLPALAGMFQDHYSSSMLTREGFDDMNTIRSSLIRQCIGIEENYIEVDIFNWTIIAPADAEDSSDTQVEGLIIKDIIDTRPGNDPTREIDIDLRWPTISVLALPKVEYTHASVFIVRDGKMGPRYPEGSRHVLHPIENKEEWGYLTGLHAVSIKGSWPTLRRITANRSNFLDLADADGNAMSVLHKNINMIWRVGQTVHMPAEQ